MLPKIPHILVTGHTEIKLVLAWKLPYCWLDFIVVPECAMQAAAGY